MRACVSSVLSGSVTLWTVAHQVALSVAFAVPSSKELPNPEIEAVLSPASLALQEDFLPLSRPGLG